MKKRKARSGGDGPRPPARDRFAADQRDFELVRRAQQNDERAFGELVEKYKKQVAGLAFKMVGDYEDARDISQIVFVKAFHFLKAFDTRNRFSTWLFRVTVNAAIDYWRRGRKFRHEKMDEEVEERPDDLEKTPEREFMKKEVGEKVRRALTILTPRQRSVFVLSDLEGLEVGEVAAVMKMPRSMTRWHLHRARARLRMELLKEIRPPEVPMEPPDGKKEA